MTSLYHDLLEITNQVLRSRQTIVEKLVENIIFMLVIEIIKNQYLDSERLKTRASHDAQGK